MAWITLTLKSLWGTGARLQRVRIADLDQAVRRGEKADMT